MLLSLRSADTPTEFNTDICIVGSGAAGISLAEKLSQSGRDVIILEAGGLAITQEEQDLMQGESVGRPFVLEEGRARVLGGATSRWRGRCAAFSPIDFEAREWVPNSGWPIPFEQLAQYFPAAQIHCGFTTPWIADSQVAASRVHPSQITDCSPLHPFVWRFAPIGRAIYQNWAVRFGTLIKRSDKVRVIIHANASRINPSPSDNHVNSIEVATIEGRRACIYARQFVLACGGVDNARLALNFADQCPALFGKVSNTIGRYFMQHPKTVTATIDISQGMDIALQQSLNLFLKPRGTQYEVGLALSESAQRSFRLLNCSGHIRYEPGADTGWQHLKLLLSREEREHSKWRHAKGIIKDPRRIVRNALRRSIGLPSLYPAPRAKLVTELEQVPDWNSRIYISAEQDALGLRKACADWRISAFEAETALAFTRFVDVTFRQAGWGSLKINPELEMHRTIGDSTLSESYHHIGATRMSAAPQTGVVDSNCKVHGIGNLFITGASVMPTGGHVNPTFMIVALAIKLGDHLNHMESVQ